MHKTLSSMRLLRDISYAEVCDFVQEEVARYSEKYAPATQRSSNLLFYIDLQDVYGCLPNAAATVESVGSPTGFDLCPYVMGRLAGVLMAAESAPEFLGRERGLA